MSFVSLEFYPCLFLAGLGFYALPSRWRALYLLGLSLGFSALSSPLYAVLLLAATGAVYWAGLKIAGTQRERVKTIYLYLGAGAVGGMLVAFKAAGALHGILLPLGLSYYSFKLIAYVADVYWDDTAVERDFGLVALYAAFFPQIVSGPIQRPGDFLAQMREAIGRPADYSGIEEGFGLILAGLMMKMLIGDRLGAFIDIVDQSPGDYQWRVILTVVVCYTLQLYADFSGYTNIAIGIGKIFGINGPPNFNAPFAAANIQQMWQRWHMSLTTWVTDYLFAPLSMALRDWGKAGVALCIAVNFIVIGLWHGFTVNFLIFGACHALFVAVTAFTLGWRNRIFGKGKVAQQIRVTLGVVLTFGLMTFSQIFWHTGTWAAAVTHFDLLFGIVPSGELGFKDLRPQIADPLNFCMIVAFYVGAGAPGWIGWRIGRFIPNWVRYACYILLLSALTVEPGTNFIYGQF